MQKVNLHLSWGVYTYVVELRSGRVAQWPRELARQILQIYFHAVSSRCRDMEATTVVFMQACARSLSHHR